MRNSLIAILGMLLVSNCAIAKQAGDTSTQDCKRQAAVVDTLLDMTAKRSLPASDQYKAELARIKEAYSAGEFCQARDALFTLQSSGTIDQQKGVQ